MKTTSAVQSAKVLAVMGLVALAIVACSSSDDSEAVDQKVEAEAADPGESVKPQAYRTSSSGGGGCSTMCIGKPAGTFCLRFDCLQPGHCNGSGFCGL